MEAPFLHQLPIEVRLKIYELVLPFRLRLKLRQHIPGLLDLFILRVCRQTYHEALPVFYDSNVIVVTRNDFCKKVSTGLQTPVKLDQARHLHMVTFNKSISCTLGEEADQCDVCRIHAVGLIRTLLAMPRLKTALIWHNHFQAIVRQLAERLLLEPEIGVMVEAMSGSAYCLRGPALIGKDIVFLQRGVMSTVSPCYLGQSLDCTMPPVLGGNEPSALS